jgi:hypothetical protein
LSRLLIVLQRFRDGLALCQFRRLGHGHDRASLLVPLQDPQVQQ